MIGIQLNYLARVRIGKGRAEVSNQLHIGSSNLSRAVT